MLVKKLKMIMGLLKYGYFSSHMMYKKKPETKLWNSKN